MYVCAVHIYARKEKSCNFVTQSKNGRDVYAGKKEDFRKGY